MVTANLHRVCLHFNLRQISWNLCLNPNILLKQGGRKGGWLCECQPHTHMLHTAQTFEGFTWGFPNWIPTPGSVETGPAPPGPSTSRRKRSPISLLAAGWALCFWGEQRFKKWSISGNNLCHILSSRSTLFWCYTPEGNFTNVSDSTNSKLWTFVHQRQPIGKSLFKEDIQGRFTRRRAAWLLSAGNTTSLIRLPWAFLSVIGPTLDSIIVFFKNNWGCLVNATFHQRQFPHLSPLPQPTGEKQSPV